MIYKLTAVNRGKVLWNGLFFLMNNNIYYLYFFIFFLLVKCVYLNYYF